MNPVLVLLITFLCTRAGVSLYPHLTVQRVKVFHQINVDGETNVYDKETLDEAAEAKDNDEAKLEVKFANKFNYADEIKIGDNFKTVEVKVSVNTGQVVNIIEDFYLSFNIDSYIFQPDVHWLKFNFSSPKIYTLLAAISPALLRVGGSPADWLFFNKPLDVLSNLHLKPAAIVLTKSDIVNLVSLTRSTGNRLLFDFNLQLRFGLQWDPSNAIELLEFCSEMGFGDNMGWELGNEPEYNSAIGQIVLTPKQIGEDFVSLKTLLGSYPNMAKSMVVGPDIEGTTSGSTGLKIIQGVANATGNFLKAITFHHYYFRGDVATFKDYLNPTNFANLAECIQNVRDTIRHSKYPNLRYWLGETSDSWHSGTENVSDRFVSGFLWLDKLGLAARMGVGVVMRQTLYGHYYSLLDVNMDPNPDFWLSWLHHILVGNKVLSVTLSGRVNASAPTTRVYAHCTNIDRSVMYKKGSVTVFALNIDQKSSVSLDFTGSLAGQSIDAYILEPDGPDGVLSKWVKLNGKRLEMPSDTRMPNLVPYRLPPGAKVMLPPLTFGFFVYPNANVAVC